MDVISLIASALLFQINFWCVVRVGDRLYCCGVGCIAVDVDTEERRAFDGGLADAPAEGHGDPEPCERQFQG